MTLIVHRIQASASSYSHVQTDCACLYDRAIGKKAKMMEPPPLSAEQKELLQQQEEAQKAARNPRKTKRQAEMKVHIVMSYYAAHVWITP
jgi:hypothetical protein